MRHEDDGWQLAMKRGDFERAWTISDRALRVRGGRVLHHLPRHLQNIWNGSPLEGRVLIRCYHGLGDTLQFARYVPLVQRHAAETIMWTQPSLIELLREPLHGVRLLPLHDGAPEVAYDVDVEIMELAHVFRTTPETVPLPLLFDRRACVSCASPDAPLRVGLVWMSGNWDPARNIPFARLGGLLQCDVQWMLLQDEATPAEKRHFTCTPRVETIPLLADAICSCHLIITVDTMAAHLAGSFGVPTWTLLRHDADWRWLSTRRDSPWYPAMRLYRQPTAGEWDPVLQEVIADLEHWSRRIDRSGVA